MTLGLVQILALDTAPSTTAGIITAIGVSITAVGGVLSVLTVLIPILKTVKVTHTIVNQQHTDQERYNIALTELLKKNNIELPVDQSKPVPGYPDAKPGEPKV